MKARRAAVLALLLPLGGMGGAWAQAPEAAFTTVETLPAPTTANLFDVSFPTALHGYAVGAWGVIVATKDGGRTWAQQRSGIEEPPTVEKDSTSLTGVSFTDALRGWAVGGADLILSTTDGGERWVRREAPPINERQAPRSALDDTTGLKWNFTDVQFTDARRGHLVGAGGAIFATEDAGATWVWQGDARYGALKQVNFTDPSHGRAVGEARPESFVTITTADGGASWTIDKGRDVGAQIARTNFQAVSFVDAQRGYVASDSGRIFATTDGGRNWHVQRKDTTETFFGVASSGARRAAAVGYTDFADGRKAAIVTTGDGGETWVARPAPGVMLWDVVFAEPTVAYAVGCQVFAETCQKSLIVRISFPSAPTAGSGNGGFAVPLPFLAAGVVLVAALSWILAVRRRPGGEKR